MKSKLLDEASDIIFGERQEDYGPPAKSFWRIADFWTVAFKHKLKDGEGFTADDIIMAMQLIKISRWLTKYKRDHPRDIAGYAGLAERVREDEAKEELHKQYGNPYRDVNLVDLHKSKSLKEEIVQDTRWSSDIRENAQDLLDCINEELERREMQPPFEGDPDQEDFSALKEDQTSQRQADQSHARSVIAARTPEDSLSLEKLHGRQLEGNRPTDMEGLPTEELNKILKSSDTSEEDFCEAKAALEKRESPVGVKNATTQIQPIPNWKAIVCTDSDGNIGRDGKLPWPSSEGDLKHFKNMTMGHIVVFGRKTYESIPVRLKGRQVVVVSKSKESDAPLTRLEKDEGVSFVSNTGPYLMNVVTYINKWSLPNPKEKTVWICGGASIYKQLLPYCSEVHWTWLSRWYGGDTQFRLDDDVWAKTSIMPKDNRTFYIYKRK